VIKTIATKNQGIDDLLEQILLHRSYLIENDLLSDKRKQMIGREIIRLLKQKISQSVHERMQEIHSLDDLIERIYNREKDPYSCVDFLLEQKVI
jgi:LAO/AO transport system kinase